MFVCIGLEALLHTHIHKIILSPEIKRTVTQIMTHVLSIPNETCFTNPCHSRLNYNQHMCEILLDWLYWIPFYIQIICNNIIFCHNFQCCKQFSSSFLKKTVLKTHRHYFLLFTTILPLSNQYIQYVVTMALVINIIDDIPNSNKLFK